MTHNSFNQPARIEYHADQAELICTGDWTIVGIQELEKKINQIVRHIEQAVSINGAAMTRVDSAGAVLIDILQGKIHAQGKKIAQVTLIPQCQALLKLIAEEKTTEDLRRIPVKSPNSFYLLGKWVVKRAQEYYRFNNFIGRALASLSLLLKKTNDIPWKAMLCVINDSGYQALPIVGLLTFLVGIVVTYQVALHLQHYGASSYIVDISGTIIFREFAPLVAAIIAAGRTSTAFAAQIGSMVVNEEVDALQTMGISPVLRLVVPKLFGLMITLPLVTVWADLFGVMGAMLMAKLQLGISYQSYLQRFEHVIVVRHYLVGLVKTPFFAASLALIGCYQGFHVSRDADSIGRKTTRSAVQSLFWIIIIDAIFSIVLSMRGY